MLYRVVNNLHDTSLLQHDLQTINEQAKSSLLDINLSKCKVMPVGNSTSDYDVNDNFVSASTCERILGVFLDGIYLFRFIYFEQLKNLGRCVIIVT